MINQMECPHCKKTINVEQVLYDKIQKNVNANLTEKEKDLEKRELEFAQKKANENQLFQNKINQEKDKIRLELEEANKKKDKEKNEYQQQQFEKLQNDLLAISRDRDKLEFQAKNWNFEKQQIELDIKSKTRQETIDELKITQETIVQKKINEATEPKDQKIKELELQINSLKKTTEEMQQKVNSTSMQLQGEAQEVSLEEFLKKIFPYDLIEEVGKGVKGADIIQTVFDSLQQDCGKIIYESKRTQDFAYDWIGKLKVDQTNQGAIIAILVTKAMPKGMEHFGQKDGIWICSFTELKIFIPFIRETLVREKKIKNNNENIGDKKQRLYDYLISERFALRITNIIGGFAQMKEDLETEKRRFLNTWKKREAQLDLVIESTSEMYGTIQGIGGSVIPKIDLLEFPDNENTDTQKLN